MPQPLILSLGSINADFTFEIDVDLGKGGTLPARSFSRRAGGKAANVAAFVHRLGAEVLLLGRVGDDALAEQALQPLRQLGIELSGVSVAPGATGIAMIAVPNDGNKTILLAPNANMAWDAKALTQLESLIDGAPDGSVLAIDFEVSREALEVAFATAATRGHRIVADASFADCVEARDLPRLAAITPNAVEASTVTGVAISSDEDAGVAARRLADAGVGAACVKLKEGGCIIAIGDKVTSITAPEVDVVDKTGAGDAFTAAVALAPLEGRQLLEAAQWGVSASTLSVMRSGSQESYPDRGQFEAMLNRVREAYRE